MKDKEMTKLTIEQLQSLEALTGKHHSIVDGKVRKTRRTASQSFKLGLMISPKSIKTNEELAVLIKVYETILGYEVTEFTSRLKLELLQKRYEYELENADVRIKSFDKNLNFIAEPFAKSELSSLFSQMRQQYRKDYLEQHIIELNDLGLGTEL